MRLSNPFKTTCSAILFTNGLIYIFISILLLLHCIINKNNNINYLVLICVLFISSIFFLLLSLCSYEKKSNDIIYEQIA